MKKLFFLFFILVGSFFAQAESDPQESQELDKVFNQHLTPGTSEQKEYAIQNPGKWVRIADQRKLGSQRNKWGIREEGELTIVRLISYDEKKGTFLLSERVALFEKNYLASFFWYWVVPILSILPILLIWYILVSLFEEYITATTVAVIALITISWYCNWGIMWVEIIFILRCLIQDLYSDWMDRRKKKTKQ